MRSTSPKFLPGLILLLLAFGLSWLEAAHALSTDKHQPIHIEADHADIDERNGVSVFRGNVVLTQGSLRLTADTLTVYKENDDIAKAVAEGKPATYRQRPDGKPEDIQAKAKRMEYDAHAETVELLHEAVVWQGGDNFASERIVYDMARDVVNAGNLDTESGSRVRIVIQPRQNGDKRKPDTQNDSSPEPSP